MALSGSGGGRAWLLGFRVQGSGFRVQRLAVNGRRFCEGWDADSLRRLRFFLTPGRLRRQNHPNLFLPGLRPKPKPPAHSPKLFLF